jgi:hypothetical protein
MGSDRFDRSKVTEIDYSSGSVPFKKETFYSYSPDLFRLTRTRQKNSVGQDQEQSFWYANDYSETLSNAGIAALKTNNIVSLPLKTITTNNGQITSGTVNQCNNWGNILQTYVYESNLPQALPTHDANTYYPVGFNLKQTLSYNADNKIQQQAKVNDIPTTYLWGYNRSYPIAEIKNATYAEVVAVLGQAVIDELAGASPGTEAQVRQKLAPCVRISGFKKPR